MGRKPRYKACAPFPMPMGFPEEGLSSGLRYRACAGDVFVCAYPKCGTTWVQHMVYVTVNGGEPVAPEQKLTDVFPHLEEVGREAVTALPEPRLIKTHLPFSLTPFHPRARYVYVARNPFDCVVSFFHHTRGFPQHYDFVHGTFDTFFECFLAGEVDFGDYFDNLLSWYPHRDDENVLFLTYEALKAQPREAAADLGAFLGMPEARKARRIEAVLRHSSFEKMRGNQQRWSSARPEGMPGFVRKGIVGDWKRELSPGQARRLAEKFARRAEGTGLESLWPGILTEARQHCCKET